MNGAAHTGTLIINGFNRAMEYWRQSDYSGGEDCLKDLAADLSSHSSAEINRAADAITTQLMTLPASARVYLFSFFMHIADSKKYLLYIYDIIKKKELEYKFSTEIFYRTYYFCLSKNLFDQPKIRKIVWSLYETIYTDIEKNCKISVSPYDPIENSVAIVAHHMLSPNHAPTWLTLKSVETMKVDLEWDPFLLSGNQFPDKLRMPFFSAMQFNSNKNLDHTTHIRLGEEGEDFAFPFFQVRQAMPDATAIAQAIDQIARHRPALVIAMGPANYLADLCRSFAPVLTFQTSNILCPSMAHPLALCREPTKEELYFLSRQGRSPDTVIQFENSIYLPNKGPIPPKEKLGLPEGKIIAAIVGGRLDVDCSQNFLSTLQTCSERYPDLCFAFIGSHANTEQSINEYPQLAANAVFIPFQKDILAVYDLCDLYVNPPRNGGGHSGAYAMASGLPVITLNYGDVATYCDPGFCLERLEQYPERLGQLLDQDVRRQTGATMQKHVQQFLGGTRMWRGILEDFKSRGFLAQ